VDPEAESYEIQETQRRKRPPDEREAARQGGGEETERLESTPKTRNWKGAKEMKQKVRPQKAAGRNQREAASGAPRIPWNRIRT
jgi:hypothetical protein